MALRLKVNLEKAGACEIHIDLERAVSRLNFVGGVLRKLLIFNIPKGRWSTLADEILSNLPIYYMFIFPIPRRIVLFLK